MKEQISNCCKASVKVDTADEGTSCYVCSKCSEPCDVQVKEQVSVDKEYLDFLAGRDKELARIEKMENEIIKRAGKCVGIKITFDEINRLKRLDENVKKLIELKKQVRDRFNPKYPPYHCAQTEIDELESLYK